MTHASWRVKDRRSLARASAEGVDLGNRTPAQGRLDRTARPGRSLDLRYATSAPSQAIDGDVTIVARATQSLSRFNLDFAGASVGSVSVNHRSAAWTREGGELVITPKRALSRHRVFTVQVSDFVAAPTVPDPSDFTTAAFFITPDGSATAPQPDNAHRIFPSNDHPRDKASYSFRIDTPSDVVAVTNGVRVSKRTRGGRTDWLYVQRQPMRRSSSSSRSASTT